jgi:hypothetical protein
MTILLTRGQSAVPATYTLERAILETLAYFDIFDYPLRRDELFRYLHGVRATQPFVDAGLQSAAIRDHVESSDGYVFLAGRSDIIALREVRRGYFHRAMPRATSYGRILGRLPFIRMVAMTGSCAMQNGDSTADLDFLLVTAADRLWLGRAFAVLLGRLTAVKGDVLCPNVIISERALLWPQQELYAAHELTQMVPLAGAQMYARLREINSWALTFLPNASGSPSLATPDQKPGIPQQLAENALKGKLGTRLENWEMRRKIARLTRQSNRDTETLFTADICQGNFDHHGELTRQAFRERLDALGLESPLPLPSAQPVLTRSLESGLE